MEKESVDKIEYSSESVSKPEEKKFNEIWGMFGLVTTTPTGKPTKAQEQIKFQFNGTNKRMWICNPSTGTWFYSDFT